ncbi:MAG TPA: hypothetical protein VMM60_09600 [Ilumatobacter sp.]|nr:hypothetical protein [Ilumatobacter sp.]
MADVPAEPDSLSPLPQRIADVITLPARTVTQATASATTNAYFTARRWLADEVDDWGRDNGLTNRIWMASQLRWDISVGGTEHLPKRSGALIVVNARRFALAPLFAALAIGADIDRPVRFVGRPDIAPFGPSLQRMGALLPIAAELEGALRAGQLIVVGAGHERTNARSGAVDHRLVGAAIAAKVPVFPAATASVLLRRNARVEVGAAVKSAKRRRGPLEELETADAVRARIDSLLVEMGGTLTGTPLDWFPLARIGAL